MDWKEDFSIEKKLTAKERNKLKDSDFGIPDERKFPLHDEAHVKSAMALFKKGSRNLTEPQMNNLDIRY